MNRQQIIFDLDDTLIHCNRYFYHALDRFSKTMVQWFADSPLTTEDFKRKQVEIDVANVAVRGLAAKHFPDSLVQTYRHFSQETGRLSSTSEEQLLEELGFSVFDYLNEPYPHMEATLHLLAASGHELHLYTGGEETTQRKKIERLELERYFGERIYIREHKNVGALEQILENGSFDRSNTWMIGNSLRTDIVPALTAGLHAIHMIAEIEWAYNEVNIEVSPQGAFYTLDQLKDVPQTIHAYGQAHTGS